MNLREFFDRYGVSLGVLAVLAVLVAVVPSNAPNSSAVGTNGGSQAAARGGAGGSAGDASGVAGGTGGAAGGASGGAGGAVTGNAQAQGVAGSSVTFGSGPNCRPDGRQIGITLYMPPCANWSGGDNGGATAPGVTNNQIKVIRWVGQVAEATRAVLAAYSLADDSDTVKRAYDALRSYSNHYYETYGREVVFEDFFASAESDHDEAMIADAQVIADKHPFAVIEGDPAAAMPSIMARELSARGVLCLCTTSLSHEFYMENPLVMATGLPTGTDYCNFAAEYVGKRLAGKNAIYAGDELAPTEQHYTVSPRVFGLLYLNGNKGVIDPEGERLRNACDSAFAQYGVSFAAHVNYTYDPGNNQSQVGNMIAQMKGAGVTTVVPIVDPLSPIFITTEATRQHYFPEWFVTGTGLSDTTTAARLYDQNQWRHAFGMTPLWVTWSDRKLGPGWREYHDARPQDADKQEGVLIEIYRARIQTLFRGIHMAGPTLNYDTYRNGMYAYPATPVGGGTASHPYVYSTADSPTDIKDFAEVYYDITQTGPDERSEFGTGMMMKTDLGARYQLGQWPSDDPHVKQASHNPVAVSDTLDATDPPFTSRGPYGSDGCLSCT